MKLFKQVTLNKIVVMGRETFESLPGKQPLKERINIVLSKNGNFDDDRIIACRSLEELFIELKKYSNDDIFIIGGESIYSQLLSYCSEAYITKINKTYTADKYFVNLDKEINWNQISQSELKTYNNVEYCFGKYVNNKIHSRLRKNIIYM